MFHNLVVTFVGIGRLRKNSNAPKIQAESNIRVIPRFSIVMPVKNEEKVVGRLLESVSNLDYPSNKYELVIVEDGSNDGTFEVCEQFAARHTNVRLLRRSTSDGKPSALNHAIKECTGEIVGFFDADAVPSNNILLKAAHYFEDSSVAAIQGRNLSINSNENMLTRIVAYEEMIVFHAYLQGKEDLGLFVNLRGSCQFIRANVLRQLGGFDEAFLSEDIEISARLTENGHRIRYCSDLCSWQETPTNLTTFLKQRLRWGMGYLQVAFKYKRLLAKITRKTVDAEIALLAPIIGAMSMLLLSVAFLATDFLDYPFNTVLRGLLTLSAVATLFTLVLCGFALVYLSKPKQAKNLLWFPFLYLYLNLQVFLTVYAALFVISRRPRKWTKTERTGAIANPEFHLENPSI